VESWEQDGKQFRIHTPVGTVLAERLVITAGAWSGRLSADLQLPLKVLRKVLVWVKPQRPELFRPDSFPVFSFSDRFLYGSPNIGGKAVKLAIHHDQNAPVTDADIRQAGTKQFEIEPALRMATKQMPGLAGSLRSAF
jgi:glycine/D-amino acid oxidase-like deaminating enzyme